MMCVQPGRSLSSQDWCSCLRLFVNTRCVGRSGFRWPARSIWVSLGRSNSWGWDQTSSPARHPLMYLDQLEESKHTYTHTHHMHTHTTYMHAHTHTPQACTHTHTTSMCAHTYTHTHKKWLLSISLRFFSFPSSSVRKMKELFLQGQLEESFQDEKRNAYRIYFPLRYIFFNWISTTLCCLKNKRDGPHTHASMTHTHTHIHVCACTHAHTHTHIHSLFSLSLTHTHTHTHSLSHTHTHSLSHTHTHTHIHTKTNTWELTCMGIQSSIVQILKLPFQRSLQISVWWQDDRWTEHAAPVPAHSTTQYNAWSAHEAH